MTTNAQHTPGPWHIFPPVENSVGLEPGQEVHALYGAPWMDESELMPVTSLGRGRNQLANARLIAAAPALLEAAEGLMEYYRATHEGPEHDEAEPHTVYVRALKAIAQATGKKE